MVSPGDAFRTRAHPFHCWIVLTRLDEQGEVVIVNLTTLDLPEKDQGCILEPSDFPAFVRHPTSVFFSGARSVDAWQLENSGGFTRLPALPPATFAKIREAALESSRLKNRFKGLLQREDRGGSDWPRRLP